MSGTVLGEGTSPPPMEAPLVTGPDEKATGTTLPARSLRGALAPPSSAMATRPGPGPRRARGQFDWPMALNDNRKGTT